jgi:PAS domain S-box-containing protein
MLTDNLTAPLILVVEDDGNHAELIMRSFHDAPEQYRLEIAGTICAAKKSVGRLSPDLVITDYHLPDGDGSELVVMAAAAWPVIMMTSHGSERVAVEAMKIGAQDYIVKSPEAFENLPRTVKYALISWTLVMVRREAADAALRAKLDWERTFDAVPDLITIIDINYTIIRANKAMADRCNSTPEKLVGLKCHAVVHGLAKSPNACPVAAMMQDCRARNVEVEEKYLNGFFDVTVSPLLDGEGLITSFVHVMRDITERKHAEEERHNLERQFQHAQKLESLGVLSGGIAHDFNNILTIILGHCYILKGSLDSGGECGIHLGMIEASANRAADLCRQMLAYAGNSPLLQSEFSMWMLVDEIVKMLTAAINKNVTIKVNMKLDLPMIVGDSSQIQQVVMNLIINASEAIGTDNGVVTVALKKMIFLPDQSETDYFGVRIFPGTYACLEVSDTGCGMSDETKLRVFEPFYTTKFTGRGLGMSAILGIIKAHNGTLQLVSTKGVGTTFKIFLPVTESGKRTETMPQDDGISVELAKSVVLLVDDEETLLVIETIFLKSLGFFVITANNGRDALEQYKARSGEIDLVMLDLIMPEMGGIEAYLELRKINSRMPIILCSGYGAEAVSDIIKTDDKACFLHKPYNPIELRKVLNDMIVVKNKL